MYHHIDNGLIKYVVLVQCNAIKLSFPLVS